MTHPARYAFILAVAFMAGTSFAQELPAPVKEPPVSAGALLPPPSTEPSPPLRLMPVAEPVPIFPRGLVPWIAPMNDTLVPGNTMVSLGYWTTMNSGSVIKTGEWQGMSSSPFWVVDGLYSNGYRTFGIYTNQSDNDTNQAGAHYFQPNFVTDFDYQRFIHRLEHVPLTNFLPDNAVNGKLPSNTAVLEKDLSPNQEYAIRVEELKSSTGWNINDNVRVRLDFWQMRKFGERQENAVAHCFTASAGGTKNCHVVSQSQHIDWTTTEVTPRIEAKMGPLVLEYSRPMRQFIQDDQMITRYYNNGSASVGLGGTYPYAVVPQTVTQIDQFRGSLDLGPTDRVFAYGYVGDTHNQDRNVDRYFNGADLRLTDWTLPRTSLTVYGRIYNQTGTRPATLDPSETLFLTTSLAKAEIRTPLEFHRSTGGVKGNWRPYLDSIYLFRDVTYTAGYEYDRLGRVNAIWQTPFSSSDKGPPGFQEGGNTYEQSDTTTQTFFIGARKPWTYTFDTFVRYKVHFTDNVLFGYRELSNVLNTSLPQQQHIVEFGGGWYPVSNFSLTLDQNIQVGRSYFDNTATAGANVVDFREQSYATTLTALFAPTNKLTFITAFSLYNDWINQNVFLGDDYVDPDDPTPPGAKMPLASQPTLFTGRAELVTFNMNYKLTDSIRLTLGYQFTHSDNQFSMAANPTFAFPPSQSSSEPKGTPLTFGDLATYSGSRSDIHKATTGIFWRIRPRATLSAFYNLFSFLDELNGANSGMAHQVNANFSCVW